MGDYVQRFDDPRFSEYYKTECYRGFRKIRDDTNKLTNTTFLIFSNGKRRVFASGGFREEVLSKIFDRIDKYYASIN